MTDMIAMRQAYEDIIRQNKIPLLIDSTRTIYNISETACRDVIFSDQGITFKCSFGGNVTRISIYEDDIICLIEADDD
jgi:stringent starvation protein B